MVPYLELFLFLDPLLLRIRDEDEDWPRLIFVILLDFDCKLLASCNLREEAAPRVEVRYSKLTNVHHLWNCSLQRV